MTDTAPANDPRGFLRALAADTDGIDGVEDNAGAVIAPDTLARAQARGLSATGHLARHDAYGFFSALDDLVVTGPTFTKVNDFRALALPRFTATIGWVATPSDDN